MSGKRESFWTDARTSELRRLWAAGLSINDIADVIGCSRGAVAGARDRAGLPERVSPFVDRGAYPSRPKVRVSQRGMPKPKRVKQHVARQSRPKIWEHRAPKQAKGWGARPPMPAFHEVSWGAICAGMRVQLDRPRVAA